LAGLTELVIDEAIVEGAVSFERGPGWVRPWRLPFEEKALFPPQPMTDRGALAAGIRLRFRTTSTAITLKLEPVDYEDLEQQGAFDLVIDGKLIQTIPAVQGTSSVAFSPLPAGSKLVEIWMPVRVKVRLRALVLDEDTTAAVIPDTRPRWTAYGSSITFCGECHSPSRTWPAIVAIEKDLNLTCFGFPGNCHMEPMVARLIRDIPADMISLKIGINIHGGTLHERTFKPALIGMVKLVREKQPLVPIAVISPISSPNRETKPGSTGLTLQKMRAELEDAVTRLIEHGDRHIRYFDGRTLLTENEAPAYLPDGLHPNGDGYELIGRRFCDLIYPWLAGERR